MSADPVDVLRRWEAAGGTWEVVIRASDAMTVRLCTCTGGEEVDRLVSASPALAEYVGGRSRSDD
ncbi:hypothetical protein [Nocardioides sp. CER19]|uniref:hypothetical protein n=1 Tax=Nocardioides sp. CER19 TaxID=3038538 RepID=UPI00244C4414|nr:hypothetical protein [Nocardioides sp. CER19]MDH2413203.1 hypothetical protein [Nocardioides sp. CER19]